MKLIRIVLGAIILFFDRVFSPKAPLREPGKQRALDAETRELALYQFEACPFCVKVRRYMKSRGLNIELRDVNKNPAHEKELVSQGGQRQVPCLRIKSPDGSVRWMYESSEIIAYLGQRFQG